MFIIEELLDNIKNSRNEMLDRLKKSSNPVVIYGAARTAERMANFLNDNGIKVSAFFVDDIYYKPGKKINEIKVLSIKELNDNFEFYNVVFGFFEYGKAKKIMKSGVFNSKGMAVFFDDAGNFDYDYLKSNLNKFQETYDLLSDDLSKQIYISFLRSRLSGLPDELVSFCTKPQYFCDLISIDKNEVFVDCGAYDGDTLFEFNKLTNGNYTKIYAFEPGEDNYINLSKNTAHMRDIKLIKKGVWKENAIFKFMEDGTSSSLNEHGNIEIHATSIDNIIDADMVTFIKMDIEGSELAALEGAKNTIKRCMPKLAICVYHKKEDMITIPQYISQFNSENKKYKLYLRHHSLSSNETVLYAIPVKK